MKDVLWFSPLPPARTEIANYSARLARDLQRHAELVFCYPDEGQQSPELKAMPISALTAERANKADLCVFQIGNHAEFHGQIWEWACRHPGLIVLHDRAIHDFFLGHLGRGRSVGLGTEGVGRYLETMAYWYGVPGYQAALEVYSGQRKPMECANAFPLYETALCNALAVVTHNPVVADEIRTRFPLLPVLDLPLPYPEPEVATPRRGRGDTIRLLAFGFMGGNRRLLEFVEAWAASPWRDRFELDLAGEMPEVGLLDKIAGEAGLRSRIRYHGFVSDTKLDELLRRADLALNLRYPTMGEASASQLRIWANRLASVVTDVGWYGQLPDDVVIKIRYDHEREDILMLLEQIATGAIDLAAYADAGLQRLSLHAQDRYVKDLFDWFERERGQWARLWSARRQIDAVARQQAAMQSDYAATIVPASLYSL
jgi:glycosyltransferase involved in cell wall biosynthesis